jgi:hypothetical protein
MEYQRYTVRTNVELNPREWDYIRRRNQRFMAIPGYGQSRTGGELNVTADLIAAAIQN